MENEQEIIDSSIDTETTENTVEEAPEIDVEALKKENETLKIQKEHWRKKANEPKAEVKVETAPSQELTFKDQLALSNAQIHEDDLDEVVEYAKFKKISVSEALKSNVIKASIEEKSQLRKSAEATNTKPVRRGAVAPTAADVLSKAMKGDLPEPGSPEAELLWRARRNIK